MFNLAHSPLLRVVLFAFLISSAIDASAQTSARSDLSGNPVDAKTNGSNNTKPNEEVPKRADKAARDSARAQYKAGVKYGRASLFRQALQSFQQAVELDPDYVDAYYGMGQANMDLERYADAIVAFEKVIKLNPNLVDAYTELGRAYVKLKEPKPAAPSPDDKRADSASAPAPAKSNTESAEKSAAPKSDSERSNTPASKTETERSNPPAAAPTTEPTENAKDAEPTAELTKVYRVGVGDVLDIRIAGGNTESSTLFTVSSSGQVEHPVLGHPIKVLGLTTDEVSEAFGAELRRRSIRDGSNPQVGVRDYNSHSILVSGLVKEPGTKILRREAIPLYVVLADAQPLPEAGFVTVLSQHAVKTRTVQLSDPEQTSLLVLPGDVVSVQPAAKQFFYVGGEVRSPGELPFRAGMTLTQAIISAGGVTPKGDKVQLSRGRGDGLLNLQEFKLRDINKGKTPDPLVEPGDRITVLP
jgi:protein involved in polysaccharide export with SLBB domain